MSPWGERTPRADQGQVAAGTPILTPRGAVLIENLQPGDEVLSRSDVNFTGPVEPVLCKNDDSLLTGQ